MSDVALESCVAMAGVSVAILVARLVARRCNRTKFDLGDWLAVVDILAFACFLGVVVGVLLWGTNNMSEARRGRLVPGSEEVRLREVGSKLLLVDRMMYISTLWLAKGILWVFYADIVDRMYDGPMVLRLAVAVLIITYAMSILSSLLECQPLSLYWQVLPDPGLCVKALIQLWVIGITNIATDLMLMGLLIPVLFQVRLPWYKKLFLGALFCTGTLLVAITVIRIVMTVNESQSQAVRSIWGTAEMIGATAVANAPALYASIRQAKFGGPESIDSNNMAGLVSPA